MEDVKTSRKFSLQLHITTLFTVLIIISGLSLGWYSHSQLSKNMIHSGRTLLSNSSQELVEKIQTEGDHIHTMLKILSASNLTSVSSRQDKIDSLPILSEMLKATRSLSSLFVAYPNDDFFLYKKVVSKSILKKYGAPQRSYFMMTLRQSNKTIHSFYNINGELLKQVDDPNYDLQIQLRPWYKIAKNSNTFAITDPYIFHASQEFGVTLAFEDKTTGVVICADYTLNTLSNMLSDFPAFPSSQRIVIDQLGQVIAYQNTKQLLSEQGKFDSFQSVRQIDHPALTYLFENYKNYQPQQGSIEFSINGEQWLAKVSNLSSKNTLQLFQLVKTKELLADAYKLRDKSVFITLLIIIATLPIAWYFARLLTAPISGLTKELESIKNFDFRQDIHSKTPIKEIAELISVTNKMKDTISHFQDLSASLVSKQTHQQLLNKISQECNSIPNSEGTLIIINDNKISKIRHCNLVALDASQNNRLTQQLSQLNLSCDALLNNPENQPMPSEINSLILNSLQISDQIHWRLLPLKTRVGANLGLIAVLELQKTPLNKGKLQYAQAIASFSALSIQSQQLLAEQKHLLESFILLIAGAIDSKSPYTGGHCERVPELTKMLTRAACEDKQGAYKTFDLSNEQWEELHIAAWLHDCGKIVTPEYIVDKATKLETIYDRLNEVRMRFELLKSEAHKNYWQSLAEHADNNAQENKQQFEQKLQLQRDQLLAKLDQDFEFVAECNIGGEFMSDQKVERLRDIANHTWTRTLSNKKGIAPHQADQIADTNLPTQEKLLADKVEHLIPREHAELTAAGNQWGFNMDAPEYRSNRGELYNLSVKRGTLTDEDRFIINGHMVHTIVMLSKLPFPEHLQNIPTIAGSHHEKMDGSGYPRKIKASELPITARAMVIADIFEALTASDRPYKERKTLSHSIQIMSFMVKDNHIDPELFKLFLTSGVYLDYAKQYLSEDQIDSVDISLYL